jgi:hypothetical protein
MIAGFVRSAKLRISRSDSTEAIRATGAGMIAQRESRKVRINGGRGITGTV